MFKRLGVLSALIAVVLSLAACCAAADFSADMVTKVSGKVAKMAGTTVTGKMFRSGDKIRQETAAGQMKRVIIIRPDKKAVWILDPKAKTYTQMPYVAQISSVSVLKNESKLKEIAVKKSLGKARVNGFLCDKFQLTYKNTQIGTSTICFAKQLDWPVRTESKSAHGTVVNELRNVKTGRQASSLFEIPKGYKKSALDGHPMPMHKMPGKPGTHVKPAPDKPK